jgi:hypothetical protein
MAEIVPNNPSAFPPSLEVSGASELNCEQSRGDMSKPVLFFAPSVEPRMSAAEARPREGAGEGPRRPSVGTRKCRRRTH